MRGNSGRVVVELDPALKRRLHAKLALEGKSLKEWFLRQVDAYLADDNSIQLSLKPANSQSDKSTKTRQ